MKFLPLLTFVILLYYLIKNRSNLLGALANYKYLTGNTAGCLKLYAFADKFGKLKPDHKVKYAYITLKEGNVDEANKLFNLVAMERLKPDERARLKASHALVAWKKGNVDDAIEMLEYVNDKYKTTTTYGSLGYMYAYSGKLDKALEYNIEAYEFNKENDIIVDNLAYTYLKLGDIENAEKYYTELFEMNPSFPEGYFEYGKYLIENGDEERGIELVKKSLNCRFSFLSMCTRRDILDYLEGKGVNITELV